MTQQPPSAPRFNNPGGFPRVQAPKSAPSLSSSPVVSRPAPTPAPASNEDRAATIEYENGAIVERLMIQVIHIGDEVHVEFMGEGFDDNNDEIILDLLGDALAVYDYVPIPAEDIEDGLE